MKIYDEFEIDISDKIIEVKPNLKDIEITPSKEEQTFKSENYYGYDEVKVNGVTNEIDENITSENIKSGVFILGVEGELKDFDEDVIVIIKDNETISVERKLVALVSPVLKF